MASLWDFLPAFLQSRIPGINVPPVYAENGMATFMPRNGFAPPIPRTDGPMGMGEEYRSPDEIPPEMARKYDEATRIRIDKPTHRLPVPPIEAASATTSAPGMLPPGYPFDPSPLMNPPDTNVPPPQTPAPSQSSKFDWGADANLWPMLMRAGQGMMQPTLYGTMGAITQGLSGATEAAMTAPDQKLKRQLLKAQVGEAEQKTNVRKQAAEIAKMLPANHPARGFFALGLVEKGLEKLTPDYNQLIVVGPDGQPRLNETLMKAKAYITAAGQMKPQYGVTGYDVGGKPIHGWVYPPGMSMPGATPSTGAQPGAPSAAPTAGPPPAAVPAVPGAPRAVPTQGTDSAIPPAPPGADPYKWAEEQTKLKIQKQQGEASRKKQAPFVLQDTDRALELTKDQSLLGGTTGFMGTLYRQIPGSPADNLSKMLDSVRANIGFDRLNQMRQESPTGAALGAVQVEELRMLQSVMGSLSTSQTKEQLQFNLKRFKNAMLDVVHGPGQGPPREKLDGASSPKTGTTRGGLKYRIE